MDSLDYILGSLLGAKDLSLENKNIYEEDNTYSVKIKEKVFKLWVITAKYVFILLLK